MCPSGIEKQLIIQPGAALPADTSTGDPKRLITVKMLADDRVSDATVASGG